MNPIRKAIKAVRDLGVKKIGLFALYQLGLRTGHYRRVLPSQKDTYSGSASIKPFIDSPKIPEQQVKQVLDNARQVLEDRITLFGAVTVPLDLSLGASSNHWTTLENKPTEQDIKFIWEPARFGWAIDLARAYAFTGDAVYAQSFWEKTLGFIAMHPPNLGRQWGSAQEVAIRLMVWIFCDRVFADAPITRKEYRQQLWQAIAEHANRIPPTLVYARAQNNNHLISEAAGLYIAGLYLKDHPEAKKWHELGWQWLNWAFQNQIDEFGTYAQHSTNYHRMMLQLALFADHFRRLAYDAEWPAATKDRLAAASRWLWGLTDPRTGFVPNLGANDGAYIFPLTSQPFEDFRPVLDAAAKAFLKEDIFADPQLAEMADWFSLSAPQTSQPARPQASDMLRVENGQGHALIHTAHFQDRPSHADQLHVDLWWQGVNIAIDPGSYHYNASPPWDNALAQTAVHNTVRVDGRDQMQRAGRFLWLDWAQAEVIAYELDGQGNFKRVVGEHNGYRSLGVRHERSLEKTQHGWTITDLIAAYNQPQRQEHRAMITWQLPDWEWRLEAENIIELQGPHFAFQLKIEGPCEINLFRAGECLHGNKTPNPTWGWISPTYAVKQPSLMITGSQKGPLPLRFQSIWQFKEKAYER